MCCGRGKARSEENTVQLPPPRVQAGANGTPTFEYIGKTALTVIGPVSRTPYRFGSPGARLSVDPRDRVALSAVPVLRFVSNRL